MEVSHWQGPTLLEHDGSIGHCLPRLPCGVPPLMALLLHSAGTRRTTRRLTWRHFLFNREMRAAGQHASSVLALGAGGVGVPESDEDGVPDSQEDGEFAFDLGVRRKVRKVFPAKKRRDKVEVQYAPMFDDTHRAFDSRVCHVMDVVAGARAVQWSACHWLAFCASDKINIVVRAMPSYARGEHCRCGLAALSCRVLCEGRVV